MVNAVPLGDHIVEIGAAAGRAPGSKLRAFRVSLFDLPDGPFLRKDNQVAIPSLRRTPGLA